VTIFGRIVHDGQVEQAAMQTLQKWLPTYIAELERQTGRDRGSLPTPRAWRTANVSVNELATWPEDQLPALLVVSPGLADRPELIGGVYTGHWALGVAVITSARDKETTGTLAKLYGAAIRAVLVQHPTLEGFAAHIDWVDDNLDEVPHERQRTLGAAINVFEITVDDVLTVAGGPIEPDPKPDPTEPYDPLGTVDTVTVTVEQKPS
jgi:hypothetical protein